MSGYTDAYMDAAQTIRGAVHRVASLRCDADLSPALRKATAAIKSFQARRFAGTYADLLGSNEYGRAAQFFLEDLYSDKDYSMRDAQFARIAGGLQRIFPKQVVETAVALAELHLLTEELDRKMAEVWKSLDSELEEVSRYAICWKAVNSNSERHKQLNMVLALGFELDRLTKIPGLRMMLRMMRRPAKAAGIESLQSFLESGFDIFGHMSGHLSGARFFLTTINEREFSWIERLTNCDKQIVESDLNACLAQGGS
jgi:hypothetical protein